MHSIGHVHGRNHLAAAFAPRAAYGSSAAEVVVVCGAARRRPLSRDLSLARPKDLLGRARFCVLLPRRPHGVERGGRAHLRSGRRTALRRAARARSPSAGTALDIAAVRLRTTITAAARAAGCASLHCCPGALLYHQRRRDARATPAAAPRSSSE